MKKVLVIMICIILCVSLIGCNNQPTPECAHTTVTSISLENNMVGIMCDECHYLLGQVPETITTVEVEKEVVKEVPVTVEKEVVKEVIKEIEVEVPALPSQCKKITVDEVAKLTSGSVLTNVFVYGDTFVSHFIKQQVPPKDTVHGTHDVYSLHVEGMDYVTIKIDYSCYGEHGYDVLTADYILWHGVGILSATVSSVSTVTDQYNRTYTTIYLQADTITMQTLFDYLPYTVGVPRG